MVILMRPTMVSLQLALRKFLTFLQIGRRKEICILSGGAPIPSIRTQVIFSRIEATQLIQLI